jgi:hypothetical protein
MIRVLRFAIALAALAAACSSQDTARVAALESRVARLETVTTSAPAPAPYVPGLGEIMGLNQVRHDKLWFAGTNANWPLAAYELDELQEGLDDAVKYHPTHEHVPQPLGQLVPRFTSGGLLQLRQAVAARDKAAFATAFDALTAGCNGCHEISSFGFNVVKRPTAPPFTNQDFVPRERDQPR